MIKKVSKICCEGGKKEEKGGRGKVEKKDELIKLESAVRKKEDNI